MEVRILSLTASGSDGIWVCFELCGGGNTERKRLLISSDAFVRLGLQKGESSTEVYDAAEKEAQIYSAFRRGLNILGYGACSRNMLISKLIAKGEERSAVKDAVELICQKGFIDEAESAKREAEIAAGKLWGESRIRSHLLQKKYQRESVDQALFALEDAGVDFDLLCKKAIAKKYKTIPTERAQMQKLVAAVCRLGYSVSQIKSACIELQEEYKKDSIFG